uniref:Retinoic acid induced 1 n=1 Tax=Myripristis murdjan TaxID=586833 RepID=A0A667YJF0_9TELE
MGHDRCLTCCLCGKPANYRDLGDLCGPYYTEDSIPRKILTARHTEFFRDIPEKTDDSSNSKGCTEEAAQEGTSSGHHHCRHRRAERTDRVVREGGTRRLTLRERFRRMMQLQAMGSSSTGVSSDQGGSGSLFQRLLGEAEAKEHWAHENCTIWTKGVIMVAGRLYGLKEAASTSKCYKCQIVGASLSCCWRGCTHKYHYVCAKEIGKRPRRERERE